MFWWGMLLTVSRPVKQDSPGGMNHFPSPGVPAGADGNTGNLLAEDFGGGGLQEALQRLRGSLRVGLKKHWMT